MKLTIEIPDSVEGSLHELLGDNAEQAVKEALAIRWYQSEKLSIGQVARFLDLSVNEADDLLKRRQIAAPYSIDDLERDRATLDRVLGS